MDGTSQVCEKCNSEVYVDEQYCPSCGNKLRLQPVETFQIQRLGWDENGSYIIRDNNGRPIIRVVGTRWLYLLTGGWWLSWSFWWMLTFTLVVMFLFWFSLTAFFSYSDFVQTSIIIVILIVTPLVIRLLFDMQIFEIYSADGRQTGEVRRNLIGSTWKVLGVSEEHQATLRSDWIAGFNFYILRYSFSKSGWSDSSPYFHEGEIKTPTGTFKARSPVKKVPTGEYKGNYVKIECHVTDSTGNLCFTVIWVDHELNPKFGKEYRIDSKGIMSPFLTFIVSVCLVNKFLTSYMSYDYTPTPDYD